MGLIKLALIGGAGYYAVKHIKGEKQNGCGRHRKNEPEQGTRTVSEEKPVYYNTSATSQPPSYLTDQYPSQAPQYQYQQYPSEQQQQQAPQQSPFQQMTFIEPKKPQQMTDMVPYTNEKHVHETTRSVPVTGGTHDDALQQAMRHLDSGDQEKARQVLASAIGQKY